MTDQKMTAADALSRGIFYYRNDDVTDAAAKYFKQAIKTYPKSDEAEEAQYYLGKYYHAKFYIRKERWRAELPKSLYLAEAEYKQYIFKYSAKDSAKWLCDVRLHLSLVYQQLGDFASAEDQLQKIILFEEAKDPTIYIYQIIWSSNKEDVINYDFNSKQLAQATLSKMKLYESSGEFDNFVPQIKKWCQTQKSSSQ